MRVATSSPRLLHSRHTHAVAPHAYPLATQSVALNVAINSHSTILITLLISNNFVELKSNVFKKCEQENLFQVRA